MKYNEKLEELINQAKSDGFEYINGEFVDTKEDYVKVINVRAGTVGCGESRGDMEIFDKLYILSEENYKKLITINKNMETDEILDCICEIVDDYKDKDWQTCNCIEVVANCCEDVYLLEEEEALEIGSINNECHLVVHLNYLEEYFMSIQVLYIPIDVFDQHKQIYVCAYPINRNC